MKLPILPLALLILAVGCGPKPAENATKTPESPAATPAVGGDATTGPLAKGNNPEPESPGDGSAITFSEWKGERKGSGELKVGPTTEKLTLANIELKPGGEASIQLTGEKLPTTTFTGTWTRKDDKTVDLKITGGWGNAGTEATGALHFMDSANPHELTFKGKVPRSNEEIEARFKMGA